MSGNEIPFFRVFLKSTWDVNILWYLVLEDVQRAKTQKL